MKACACRDRSASLPRSAPPSRESKSPTICSAESKGSRMDEYCAVIEFPAMHVGIRTRNETLEAIRYLPRSAPLKAPSSCLAERVVRQLELYRDDPDVTFDLPLRI